MLGGVGAAGTGDGNQTDRKNAGKDAGRQRDERQADEQDNFGASMNLHEFSALVSQHPIRHRGIRYNGLGCVIRQRLGLQSHRDALPIGGFRTRLSRGGGAGKAASQVPLMTRMEAAISPMSPAGR